MVKAEKTKIYCNGSLLNLVYSKNVYSNLMKTIDKDFLLKKATRDFVI
jgi:hypothetical protein